MTNDPKAQTEQELEQPTEFHFEIIKLEYEQTAQRFENIYKAIWQIFSYMAALTAAIFAFGASNLPLPVVVLIAPLPLLFWWLAIFIPMDFYGRQARTRLSEIEEKINHKFLTGTGIKLAHYRKFNQAQNQSAQTQNQQAQNQSALENPKWRVSKAVPVFAVLGIIACTISFFITLQNSNQLNSKSSRMEIKLELPVQVLTRDSQLQELKEELLELFDKKLDENLDSIRSLINEKSLILNNNVGKPRR